MPIPPRPSPKVLPLKREHPRNKDVKCLNCGAFNIQENHICGKCGASLPIVYDGEGKVFNWREEAHGGSLAGRGSERGPGPLARWTLRLGALLFACFALMWYLKSRIPEDFTLLPASLQTTCFRAPNGRVAWKREQLGPVLKTLAQSGFAVVKARAWVVQAGAIRGTLMFKDAPKIPCGWGVEPRAPGEPWADFVARSLKEAQERVRTTDCSAGVHPTMKDAIYYNILFADEKDYRRVLDFASQ